MSPKSPSAKTRSSSLSIADDPSTVEVVEGAIGGQEDATNPSIAYSFQGPTEQQQQQQQNRPFGWTGSTGAKNKKTRCAAG